MALRSARRSVLAPDSFFRLDLVGTDCFQFSKLTIQGLVRRAHPRVTDQHLRSSFASNFRRIILLQIQAKNFPA